VFFKPWGLKRRDGFDNKRIKKYKKKTNAILGFMLDEEGRRGHLFFCFGWGEVMCYQEELLIVER
jgi:hypothetical protein